MSFTHFKTLGLFVLIPFICAWKSGEMIKDEHGKPYAKIVKRLGSGNAGVVFEVQKVSEKGEVVGPPFAIKVFAEGAPTNMNHEIRGYRTFSKSPKLTNSRYFLKSEPPALFQMPGGMEFLAVTMPLAPKSLKDQLPTLSLNKTWTRNEVETKVNQFTQIAAQGLEAISELVGEGMSHNDLKPENLCYDPIKGELKFADVGGLDRLGESGVRTPRYSAPEAVLDGGSRGPTGDLYALGATLYQLIFGRSPVEDYAVIQLKWRSERMEGYIRNLTLNLATNDQKYDDFHEFIKRRVAERLKGYDLSPKSREGLERLGDLIIAALERDPQKRIPKSVEHFPAMAKLRTAVWEYEESHREPTHVPTTFWQRCWGIFPKLVGA